MSIDRAKALKAAQKFLAKGQLDRAITEYQKVVASDPSDARSLLKLGDLYTRQGATADASATYRQVAEQYAEQGFFLKAVAVYKQILKLDSGDLAATEKLAEMYEMLSLTSDALSTYEQVVDAHTRAGAPDKAVNALGRLAELDPENIAARIRHAEALSKVDRIDEAADAFRLGADALKDQGRIDDYIKVTERLLFHSHEDVDRARDLASIYIERGNAKPALAHLQTCFKADPRDVNTLELLSHAFSLLGQTTKASSVLKEMVRIHADAGDTDAESAALRKLLEVDPSDPEARQRLDVLGASSSSETSIEIVEDDDLDDLIIIDDDGDGDAPAITDEDEPTETAAAGGSEDADAQITRLMSECEVFIRYGLQDKVLLTLGKVVELDPGHVEARERLKQVHLEAGDTDEAVAQLVALAEHLGESGDASGARRYLEEAQQLAPGNDSVAARLAELDGGEDAMIVDDEDDVIIVEDAEESFAGMFESEAPEPAAAMPATISQAAAATVAATSEAPAFEEDDEDDEPELVIEDSDEDLEELGVTEADLIEPPAPMPSPPAVSVPPPLPAAARAAAAVTFVDSEPPPEPTLDAGSISLPGPAAPASPAPSPVVSAPPPQPTAPAPVPAPQPAVTAPVAQPQPAVAAPVAQPQPAVAAPVAQPQPAVSAPPPESPVVPAPAPAAVSDLTPAPAAVSGPVPTPAAAPEPPAVSAPLPEPAAAPEPAAVAPAGPAPQEVPEEIADVLEEVEFYLSQDLADEAREAIADAIEEHGEHPALSAKLTEIDRGDSEPPREESEDRSFELAQKLAEEAQPTPQAGPVEVDDVLHQFKEGVKHQIDKGDTETHYDLGIAYMEMGLHSEAIDEFKLCLENGERESTAHHMIGLSHVAKGEMEPAIAAFMAALEAPGRAPQEELDLWFEIGNAYELLGKANEALIWYEKVEERQPDFRDVAERIERLGVIKSEQEEVDEFDEMFDNMILKD